MKRRAESARTRQRSGHGMELHAGADVKQREFVVEYTLTARTLVKADSEKEATEKVMDDPGHPVEQEFQKIVNVEILSVEES